VYTFCLLFVHQSTHANNTQTYTSFPDMSEIEQFKYILSSNDLESTTNFVLMFGSNHTSFSHPKHRCLWTGHSIPLFTPYPPFFNFFCFCSFCIVILHCTLVNWQLKIDHSLSGLYFNRIILSYFILTHTINNNGIYTWLTTAYNTQ
jgi:hypothetical protein